MKILKIIAVLAIFGLGIYSFAETGFYQKLTSVNRIEELKNRRHGPPEKEMQEAVGVKSHENNGQVAPGGQKKRMNGQEGSSNRKQNKWAIKLNFERGIVNILMYASIIAFLTTLVFVFEEKIFRVKKNKNSVC